MKTIRHLVLISILFLCCIEGKPQDPTDTLRIQQLIEAADEMVDIDLDSANRLTTKAIRLAIDYGDIKLLAKAYQIHGDTYLNQARSDSAIFYFEEARALFEEANHPAGVAKALNGIGMMLNGEGDYQGALNYFLDGLNILQDEAVNDRRTEAAILSNISQIYSNLQDFETANDYAFKSLEITEDIGNEELNAVNLANISYNMIALEKFNEAIDYGKQASEIFIKTNNEWAQGGMLFLLGKAHLAVDNINLARQYLSEGVARIRAFGDQYFLALIYLETARLHFRTGEWPIALAYGDSALALSIQQKLRPEQLAAYQLLSEINEGMTNFPQALDYLKKYEYLNDSLFNEKISAQMSELETRYQTEQKEQQIALQEEQLTRQSIFRNALIGGLVLLLIIAGLIYRNERVKSKALKEKESLLKEIHHRVKNNLQVISSLLNMQMRQSEGDQMLEVIQEGQSRVKAMALIHQKLYQTDNLSEIEFQDYTEQLLEQLKTLYSTSETAVESTVNANDIKLDIDTAIPLGLILNELISNAYKYAFKEVENGSLKIDLRRIDDRQLELEVTDNGPGLPEDLNLEKVRSLGLKLVNILTRQLKGQLTFENREGTRFLIRFTELKMSA